MEYKDKDFCITILEDTVVFSGKLEKRDYTEIVNFLKQGEDTIQAETVKVDLQALWFINSNGIKILAIFLTRSSKKFEVYIDEEVEWQENTLLVLNRIKPDGITIVRA